MSTPSLSTGTSAALPADPFTALQFHFGMLLGVEDLETLEAYPRGKVRLHNAWLHGAGVVWGLGVKLVPLRGELQVDPGLALDAAGHELHLDTPVCVNLGAWFQAHQNDPGLSKKDLGGGKFQFDVQVTMRFKACLTRPVPAMAEPCAGATSDIAYSRAAETVELFLRPLDPAPTGPRPYHRLRVLFSLEEPLAGDAAIVARREAIRSRPPPEWPKALLEAFQEYAHLDAIDLQPAQTADGATTLFPGPDTEELVLASVRGIVVSQGGPQGGWALTEPFPSISFSLRRTHVATSTIQELLCGPAEGLAAEPVLDAGGPRVDPASVVLMGDVLSFKTQGAVHPRSAKPQNLSVTTYDELTGWTDISIPSVVIEEINGGRGSKVTLTLGQTPTGTLVRLVVRGTGPMPLLGPGPRYVPFAGATQGPPGTAVLGHDFIHHLPLTQTRS